MARPRKPESELKSPRRIKTPDGVAVRPRGRPRKPESELKIRPSRAKPRVIKPETKKPLTLEANMVQMPVEQLKRMLDPSPQPLPPDAEVEIGNMTPLEYALQVMNDPREPKERRDRLCVAILPFCHVKKGESGKRESAKDDANKAGTGKFSTIPAPLRAVK